MPTNIKYSDIIMYLEAIAGNANKDPGNCVHHYWWHVSPHRANSGPLSYKDFTTGTVVGFGVPIIYQPDSIAVAFYLLLSTPGGRTAPRCPWMVRTSLTRASRSS